MRVQKMTDVFPEDTTVLNTDWTLLLLWVVTHFLMIHAYWREKHHAACKA